MALRWKKDPAPTGLARVGSGPRSSKLLDGKEELASVSASYGPTSRFKVIGWYWWSRVSGEILNTCRTPAPDEATAKAQAMAHVREHYKKEK